MPLPDEVASYLQTQGIAPTGSTASWSIAKGYEVDSPDRLITILETGGFPNDPRPAPDNTIDRPTFQLRVRGPANGYSTARATIGAARLVLDQVNNMRIGPSSWYYLSIRAVHEPLSLGVDNQQRPTLVMNFAAIRSRTS